MRSALRPVILLAAIAATLSLSLAVPASAEARYGAIAIKPSTGAAGISYNYRSQRGAKRRARHECGRGCWVKVWVRNGCAAVVKNPRRYVAAIATGKRRAIRKARRKAGRRAPLVAWVCSG